MAFAVLVGAPSVMAQSYPGLSSGTSQNSPSGSVKKAPSKGYGGLNIGRSNTRAPVRTQVGGEEEQTVAEELSSTSEPVGTEANDRQARAIQQEGFTSGQNLAPAIQTPEDLKMAAAIQENAKNLRETVIPSPKLREKTLAVLNKPQEKVDGMWPVEARAVSYIQMAFADIKNAPPNQRREKITAIKQQIETMMDANLVRLATDDSVSVKMGVSPAAVKQSKAAAEATNKRLQQALKRLR